MFFTKDFILSELQETRELVENTLDALRVPNNITQETEQLTRTLFKLDVIRNAIKNVPIN
jgi:hypothetical protein